MNNHVFPNKIELEFLNWYKGFNNYILLWKDDTSDHLYKLNKSIIVSKTMQIQTKILSNMIFVIKV